MQQVRVLCLQLHIVLKVAAVCSIPVLWIITGFVTRWKNASDNMSFETELRVNCIFNAPDLHSASAGVLRMSCLLDSTAIWMGHWNKWNRYIYLGYITNQFDRIAKSDF